VKTASDKSPEAFDLPAILPIFGYVRPKAGSHEEIQTEKTPLDRNSTQLIWAGKIECKPTSNAFCKKTPPRSAGS